MTIRLWDFEECKLIATCHGGHLGKISCIEPLVTYGCFVSADVAGAICLWSAVSGPNVRLGGLIHRWMNVTESNGAGAMDGVTFLTGVHSGGRATPIPSSVFSSSVAIDARGRYFLVRVRCALELLALSMH